MPVIACLVTGEARAAIATISVSGAGASAIVSRNFEPAVASPIHHNQVRYGAWHGGMHGTQNDAAAESVVVVRVASQNESTPSVGFRVSPDADTWEVHCHGGAAATKRILDDLSRSGADVVSTEAWQKACGIERLVREATEALANTTTLRTAAIVMDQVRGAFLQRVIQWMERSRANERMDTIRRDIRDVLRFADMGLHLTKPWQVVLAGPPNVGKSSLINALVGYSRSITLDQPGTTRDVLKAHAVIDGWPILLFDTAGVRDNPSEEIERQGIELTKTTVQNADLVIWIDDATGPKDAIQRSMAHTTRRSLHVINKVDLHSQTGAQYPQESIATSAVSGEGLDKLRSSIVQTLIPEMPKPGSPVPICDRQVSRLERALESNDSESMTQALSDLLARRDLLALGELRQN